MTAAPWLVTGGAGFIGSALVRALVADGQPVVTVDKLTYAGNLDSLADVMASPLHQFEQVDVADTGAVERIFDHYRPSAVIHLAAESHVDRSIDGPDAFVQTNVVGTFVLLSAALRHWKSLSPAERAPFRFLHVSTDEVFGSLAAEGFFTEATAYDPSSPYAASKAASDHLVRSWQRTYGLPVIVSNCSNNYGPYQFPEKLIPLTILNAIEEKPLPVYGRGENVRDWLHVDDHVSALRTMLARGRVGETYLVSGGNERRNLDVVHAICDAADAALGAPPGTRRRLVQFVTDRPGHDFRYAIDASKLRRELGWSASRTFDEGLTATVSWYLAHKAWWERVRSGVYRGARLGLGGTP